jgi:hypothetical protein
MFIIHHHISFVINWTYIDFDCQCIEKCTGKGRIKTNLRAQLIQVAPWKECVGVERITIFISCKLTVRYAIFKKD